jgi:hypothetical protein
MSLRVDGAVIHLLGECRVEDAEPLLAALQAGTATAVDLTSAGHLHAAIVQALLALRPPLAGSPTDPFTAKWLVPLLAPPSLS